MDGMFGKSVRIYGVVWSGIKPHGHIVMGKVGPFTKCSIEKISSYRIGVKGLILHDGSFV